jgi:hypothetical protein
MTITAARPTQALDEAAFTGLLDESPIDALVAARILNDAQREFDRCLRCGYTQQQATTAVATVFDPALVEAWVNGAITGRRAIATARQFGREVEGLT